MKLKYIKASVVRDIAKKRGRRVSKAFLAALDRKVEDMLDKACTDHNGGRSTLDKGIAYMYTGVTVIKCD